MIISNKKLFIDLKYFSLECHSLALHCEGMVNEFWKNDIHSDYGVPANIRISAVRRTIFRKLQNQELLMLGSISKHGICSTDLQGKFARYSGLLACGKTKDVPHGHPGKDFPQYTIPCQPDKRLAHICRFRSSPHSESPTTLCRRFIRYRVGTNYLRAGFHNNRSLSVSLSMGNIPQEQGSGETAYASRSERQHSNDSFYYQRQLHEVNILDKLPIEAGAIYIMDRGYLDYARLYKLHQSAAYFVTRAKNNARYHRRYYQKIDKTSGLKSDQVITLHGYYSKKDYPERLRRIAYYDEKQNKNLVFLTNNFTLPALTITEIYRKRWQIELFFKWIKQHLRIKAFYGTSENAVKTQIWIAISVYVLVAIIKKQLNLEESLYSILQIVSVTLFEKIPLLQALTDVDVMEENTDTNNQLNLFD